MLIGHYYAKLTDKNRLAIPSKFRDEIGDDAILARWYEGCLVLVSKNDWMALLDKLTGKSDVITRPVRNTDRFIMGSAFEIQLDTQGRFVMPKTLLEYANLKNDAVFVGLGNRVEIWDLDEWETQQRSLLNEASEYVEELANAKNER